MSDETGTTSEVARVLRDHSGFYLREDWPRDDWYVCDSCGVELETDPKCVAEAFHDHQADELAKAGLLRPQIATQEPAGAPGIDSAGRGASGGLGERLRALRRRFIGNAGEDDPNNDQDLTITGYTFWAVVQGLEAMANEVDVLEGKHARQAQTIGELQDVRERLGMVRELAGAIRETSHCSHLATDIETLLDTPLSELRALRDTP